MQNSDQQERRKTMTDTLTQLVNERQQVMVAFNTLASMKPFNDLKAVNHQLRQFCELMVDYTALGHFEVYQRIIEGKERRYPVKRIAATTYPPLAETTDLLVDFNDKYEVLDDAEDLAELGKDLSRLGEAFAVRIELEDQILCALTERSSDAAAEA